MYGAVPQASPLEDDLERTTAMVALLVTREVGARLQPEWRVRLPLPRQLGIPAEVLVDLFLKFVEIF